MTRHKNRGMRMKGPVKVKRIMRHYGKEERVEIKIPFFTASPDHRVLKHFGYSYIPTASPEKIANREGSFLPE